MCFENKMLPLYGIVAILKQDKTFEGELHLEFFLL